MSAPIRRLTTLCFISRRNYLDETVTDDFASAVTCPSPFMFALADDSALTLPPPVVLADASASTTTFFELPPPSL